jgi:hypothetical protein
MGAVVVYNIQSTVSYSYIFKLSNKFKSITKFFLWFRATMSVDHKDTVPVTIHYSLPMPPRVIHVPTHFSLDETRAAVHSAISQHVAGRMQPGLSITVGSSEFSSILLLHDRNNCGRLWDGRRQTFFPCNYFRTNVPPTGGRYKERSILLVTLFVVLLLTSHVYLQQFQGILESKSLVFVLASQDSRLPVHFS